MRGAHNYVQILQKDTGIIPADAGSTPTEGQREQWAEDHPRGCGEHPPGRI